MSIKPPIALTFDDGPSEHTPRILDTLLKYDAKASFFVLGKKIASHEAIIKRAFVAGHEVISHTWSHCKNPNLSELSADDNRKELNDTRDALLAVTGCCPYFFRPPYGAVSHTTKEVSAELGLAIINWSVDPADWKNQCPDTIFEKIMATIHNGAIILCHDVYDTTAEAMERVIPVLSQKYELVTVSELMRRTGITLVAGEVYENGGKLFISERSAG